MKVPTSLTERLRAFSAGDRHSAEAALREVYPRLRQIAAQRLRKEPVQTPLTPTELINEVWLRHLRKGGWQIDSREDFYAVVSCAMRHVLVDLARGRLAQKRGGIDGSRPLENYAEPADAACAEQIIEISLLMEKLGESQPKLLPIVDMHYFAGFSFEEIAELTGLTERQVRHLWSKARDWLRDRISQQPNRARSAAQTPMPPADAAKDRTQGRRQLVPRIPQIAE
jgi:RNA polymerase sigma factor (TIGR02999 family)